MRKSLLVSVLTVVLGVTCGPAAAAAPELAPAGVAERVLERTEGLRPHVLDLALRAYDEAVRRGEVTRPVLTIIDYELPSYQPRLWVVDLSEGEVLMTELVAHGMGKPRGSGGDHRRAISFSNREGTLKSSLGAFRAAETYFGKHGLSLRLDGLEAGVNDAARRRTIVIHGADYVSEERARSQRTLGRSWGCPAVPKRASRRLIETISGGSLVWAYYPDDRWLDSSPYLRSGAGAGAGAGRSDAPVR